MWTIARLLVLVSAFLAASPKRALARNLYSYDLDSLAFMSQEIVRGRIAQRADTGSVAANELVVTATYVGSFKPGETVRVAALTFFCKPGDGPRSQIGEGDEVIAFLVRAKSAFAFEIPPDAVVYIPVPSGLRVITDGKACGFRQHDNPGPYVMDAPERSPAIEALEKQCIDAVARVRPMANRMSVAATKADAPWLLGVLRSRAEAVVGEPGHRDRDAIAERACTRLAEVKDLSALDEALAHVKSYYAADELHRGFASRDGRQFLLQKLSNPAQPVAEGRRWSYARALESGVWDYDSSAPAGEDFLERLARLAIEYVEQADEPTSRILLSHLRTAASLHAQGKEQSAARPPELESDLVTALKVLTACYSRVKSPSLQFQIDVVLVTADPGLGFTSPAGPVATLLTIPGPERNYAMKPGHLVLEYEYASFVKGRRFALELVIEGETMRRSFALPDDRVIHGAAMGGGSHAVPLPADLPRGRYRLFYRVTENGKAVGDGHGVETELPPRASQPVTAPPLPARTVASGTRGSSPPGLG